METDANLADLEAQLTEWSTRMDELVAEADKARDQASAEYLQRIDALKTKHEAAQSKLDEFGGRRGDKWARFRTGAKRAWTELGAAFNELRH